MVGSGLGVLSLTQVNTIIRLNRAHGSTLAQLYDRGEADPVGFFCLITREARPQTNKA